MPENNAQTEPQPSIEPSKAPKAQEAAEIDRAHVPMGEEFDKPKWTLPPWQPVVVALVIVGVVLAVVAWIARAKPPASGSIGDVVAVTVPPGDNVLVAINISVHNTSEKPLWIHTMKAQIKTDKGEFSDDAASFVDFDRYFQAFPDLKQHAQDPLKPETKIPPATDAGGTIIVSFPVPKDEFDKKQSLTVTVQPYDRPAVLLKK